MINQAKPSQIKCPNCRNKKNIEKKISNKYKLFFCKTCINGFTHPVQKNVNKYYHPSYWESSSLLGKIKAKVFDIFQQRRVFWITRTLSKGLILDVGSGEAKFGSSLSSTYKVISIEPPSSKIKNKFVIKKDFLRWKTSQKFDAVCFWESLEHTHLPQQYLEKAYKLLKKGGYIFIEFPRYGCFEANIFGKNWFHLDLPRHLSHLTQEGLIILLVRVGFTKTTYKNIFSFDYAPWGFAASIVNFFRYNSTDQIKKAGNFLLAIIYLPLFIIGLFFEIVFFTLKQSPIGLVTAKKV